LPALHYGLGYADASLLPGRFGCFLLDPAGVRASLAVLEHLPATPCIGLEKYTKRVDAWLAVFGDEPGFDARMLLEGPMRVLRAAAPNAGAIGFTQRFC
jgi:hypothetical protein